ncbi:putative histidinol-phosphate/aromatic aminotransferase and cobyric acid decarboxylase [Desulforapulum autotrophicum HRM2]|uniref:Histidinol-phosphate/aromatic aminotransferase and cobyric acid decarboxylase n=1 Tax=Desulforapulum autotrophicum (strain ATCC 43914 / DSM 3382 / VKM B-1955 / HRM2) TaxID=177437 RepID=C0QG43_DESAH|nr:aminotransferase class I/II-fold pyridoxal phosphate-dependent enzyme [Desulforapulum autotrophicum]ACN17622.1 putative histidinol-phosphate/aromatic aminotransferase and cobyric acid decarboxylase [Desulforapulum autotrophicum HRM2]
MITGHGGNVNALAQRLGCTIDEIIDMSSNLNPLGPPPGLEAFLAANMARIRSLPQADAGGMVSAFAHRHNMDANRVMAGNGTTWFLYTLPLALATKKMLIFGPTYSDYRDGCAMHNIDYGYAMATVDNLFVPDFEAVSNMLATGGFDTVVICNPNNPTGVLVEKQAILNLVQAYPEIRFVVDESYLPFVEDAENITLVGDDRFPNLIVLSSMSKIFRIPGLRTGFICADPRVIEGFMHYSQPWSVNALAQTAVTHLLGQGAETGAFTARTREFVHEEKALFASRLADCPGICIFPSQTYFVLAALEPPMDAPTLCRLMGDEHILIRDCTNFDGLSNRFVRFSLKSRKTNMALANALNKHFSGSTGLNPEGK